MGGKRILRLLVCLSLVMALMLTAGMTLFIYVLLANLEKRHGLSAALEAPRKGDAAEILHILARRARGLR